MSSATKAPGAEGPGAYGIPGLPDRLSQSDQLRIFSAYYADRLPAEAAAELCELADEWDQEIAAALAQREATKPVTLAEGCCSASSPCEHQKADPTTICGSCQRAAADRDFDEALMPGGFN